MQTWALDPGTLQSALVVVEQGGPCGVLVRSHELALNAVILARCRQAPVTATLVVEQVECFGMPVGVEVLETVFWTGRFFEAWPNGARYRLPRRAVKLHLCASMRAKDAHVRHALLDKFGGASTAIGRKATPGPLYGLHGHHFAALAVAVTWLEAQPHE
jgi:hypothetical protein